MSTSDQDIQDVQQIEISLDTAKLFVKRSEALKRLQKNEDFKLLFVEGYLKEHAVNQVTALAYPNMQDPQTQQRLLGSLHAISEINMYLIRIHQMGDTAKSDIEAHEQELINIHNGDLDSGLDS